MTQNQRHYRSSISAMELSTLIKNVQVRNFSFIRHGWMLILIFLVENAPKPNKTEQQKAPKIKKPVHKSSTKIAGKSSSEILPALKINSSIPIWWDHEATKDRLFTVNDCPITHANYIKLNQTVADKDGSKENLPSTSTIADDVQISRVRNRILNCQLQKNADPAVALSKPTHVASPAQSAQLSHPSAQPVQPVMLPIQRRKSVYLPPETSQTVAQQSEPVQKKTENSHQLARNSNFPSTVSSMSYVPPSSAHFSNSGSLALSGIQQSMTVGQTEPKRTHHPIYTSNRRYSVPYNEAFSSNSGLPAGVTLSASVCDPITKSMLSASQNSPVNQSYQQNMATSQQGQQSNRIEPYQAPRPQSAFSAHSPHSTLASATPITPITPITLINHNSFMSSFKVLSPNELNLRAEAMVANDSVQHNGHTSHRRPIASNYGGASSPFAIAHPIRDHFPNGGQVASIGAHSPTVNLVDSRDKTIKNPPIQSSLVRRTNGELVLVFYDKDNRIEFNDLSIMQRVEVTKSLLSENIWEKMLAYIKVGRTTQQTLKLFNDLLPVKERDLFFKEYDKKFEQGINAINGNNRSGR